MDEEQLTQEMEEEQFEEEDTIQPMEEEPNTLGEHPLTSVHLPFGEMGITPPPKKQSHGCMQCNVQSTEGEDRTIEA